MTCWLRRGHWGLVGTSGLEKGAVQGVAAAAHSGAGPRGSGALSMNSTELLAGGNATHAPWGDDTGPTVWYVGVVLHLVGGALGSLGLNLQRWRHQRGQSRAPSAEDFASRVWYIGFVLVAMDAVLTCLSYAFASLCKLSTLGILALCLNTSVAPTCLKQRVHKWDRRGALIASVGAIVAISCANPKTPNYSLDQLIDYLGSARVMLSLCTANAVLVGLLAVVFALRWQSDALEAERQHLQLEYHRTHRSHSGSPVSAGGKQSSGQRSPTSGSDSLVTAPSELDVAISKPVRPEPLRAGADGRVPLELASRVQGSPAETRGADGDSGRDNDDANFGARNSPDRAPSPGHLSGPASSEGSEGEDMYSISADEHPLYDDYDDRIGADVAPAAWDYAESRLRNRPEWSKVQRLEPSMRTLYLIALPTAAGVAAGLAVVFSKISVEMGKSTVMSYDYPYTRFPAYLIVMYTLVLLSLQVKLLNLAMVAADRSFSVIVHYQVVRLGTCVMGGILFFREADTMTAAENVLFGMGCLTCVVGTLKMQGQATDSAASARHGSLAAHGHSRAGNESRINAPAGGSPLGGANRDELDDMLHLLEIDTTTRNCEQIPVRSFVFLSCSTQRMSHNCLNGRLHCVSVPVCVARACAYVRARVRI